jgi:hypothetical protein
MANKASMGSDTQVVTWNLPDFTSSITEIAALGPYEITDGPPGRTANYGASRNRRTPGRDAGAD